MTPLLAVIAALLPWMPSGERSTESTAESVHFEGNEMFSRRTLLRLMRRYHLELLDSFTVIDVDDAAFYLRQFYFRRGFPDAQVDYRFDSDGPTAWFTIREGRRVFVGEMEFEGGETLGEQRLRDIVTAAMRQATNAPFGRLRYVADAVEAACENIRAIYAQSGYLSAQTGYSAHERGDEMDLLIHIDQGLKFTLRAVRLIGAGEHEEGLRKMLGDIVGQPYTPDEELILRTRAIAYLQNHGYYHGTVDVSRTIDADAGTVDIAFRIDTGIPYRIGEISITGNRQTRLWAVKRRFDIRAGQEYDAADIDEATRRLWFSGAFSEADVELTEVEEGVLDVELTLAEAPAKEFSVTAGYGEWERAFGELTYTDRNFLGTLLRFSAKGLLSERSYGSRVQLSDPWFLNTDMTGSISTYFLHTEQPAYRANFLGAVVGVERRFDETSLTGFTVSYQWQRTFDAVVFAEEENNDPNYTVGSFGFSQILDRRNDLIAPMQGYLLSYETALATRAFLGDTTFYRLAVQATGYIPFQKITPERPFVPFLTLNHRAGMILPFADTESIPVPERFFLGGPDTVRSFQYDGMPPRDKDGDPLGGDAYLLANIEYQQPVWRALYVAVFTDIGNLAPGIDDFSWSDTRVALGAGLRFYTPIGAVRVDYGYNLIRRDGDPIGAWQFGFGFTF